ncbi:MAG: sensor histidine kinase [Deltaproteobacteria bacterium]|nr:sensor histidine kinase [Deltaproteobacteria bacterium]
MLSLFQNIKAILGKYFIIFTTVLTITFVLIGGIFLTFSVSRIRSICDDTQRRIFKHVRSQALHSIEWAVNEKKELLETLTAAIEATVVNTAKTTAESLSRTLSVSADSSGEVSKVGIASSNPDREDIWIYGSEYLKPDRGAYYSKRHDLIINEKYMGAITSNRRYAPYYKKLSEELYEPFMRIYNLYSGILWVSCGVESDGGIIGVPLGDTHPQGYDARIRGWYKDAYMNKGFVWTLPYVESSEKNMALAGTMPLRDNNGKRLGVIAVDLSISHALELSDLSSLYNGLSVLVIDSGGKVLIYDGYNAGESSVREEVSIVEIDDLPLSDSAILQIKSSKVGMIRNDNDQHSGFIMVSAPVSKLGWQIISIVPDKILTRDSQTIVSHVMRIMKSVTFSIVIYYLVSLVISLIALVFIAKKRTMEVGKRLEQDMQPLRALVDKLELYSKDERISLKGDSNQKLCKEFVVLYDAVNSFIAKIETAKKREADQRIAVALGRVASNVAHDIRSPLSVLKTYIQLGDFKSLNSDEIVEIRGASERSLEKLENMAEEMLAYSSAKRLDAKPCDMADVWNEVMDSAKIKAEKEGIRVHAEVDNVWVTADRSKMVRVLINLLNNAIEACEEGGIASVKIGEIDDTVNIQVMDNGKGIDKEDLDNIFDSMFTSGKRGGTGLGLAYCKEVIESHGGTIEVVSEVGSNTTFKIILPKVL